MRIQSPRLVLDSHLQGGVRESGSQTTSLVILNDRKDPGKLIESYYPLPCGRRGRKNLMKLVHKGS